MQFGPLGSKHFVWLEVLAATTAKGGENNINTFLI